MEHRVHVTRDHPRIRALSFAWSFPVTWQRWRSHHSIRRTRKPMLHANVTAVCLIEWELMPIEVLHCENIGIFDLFGSCDLDLDPMNSYTNLTRSPRRCAVCANMNFVRRQGFRKLSSDRYTDVHTRPKYTPRRFAGGQKLKKKLKHKVQFLQVTS